MPTGGFAKVYRSLWDGTLGQRPDAWALFVFLLAHADRQGRVDMTPLAISARSGMPLDRVRASLSELEEPDAESRTHQNDGRRLIRLDGHRTWGWQIVNYSLYRQCRDEDTRREQNRQAKRRQRSRQPMSADVSHGQPKSAYAEADIEAEESEEAEEWGGVDKAEEPSKAEDSGQAPAEETPSQWSEGFAWFWRDYPRKVGKEEARKSYQKIRPRTQETYDAMIAGLAWYKRGEWEGREVSKIPHPSTWLNQRRWTDAQTQD